MSNLVISLPIGLKCLMTLEKFRMPVFSGLVPGHHHPTPQPHPGVHGWAELLSKIFVFYMSQHGAVGGGEVLVVSISPALLYRPCCALVWVQGGEIPLEGVAVLGLVGCPRELAAHYWNPVFV